MIIKPEYIDYTGRVVNPGDLIIFSERLANGGLTAGIALKAVSTGRRSGTRNSQMGLKVIACDYKSKPRYETLDRRNDCLIIDHSIFPPDELAILIAEYERILSDPKLKRKYIEV